MEIIFAPQSAAQIRAVLGEAVDLSPRAVPTVLARLAEQAPDVYSKVLDELSGSHIRLDSERALHQRHRRSLLRRALFGWGEYESDAGDRVLAKRRIAAAVPIALAAAMLTFAALSALINHGPHVLRPSPVAHRLVPSRAPEQSRHARSATKPQVAQRVGRPPRSGTTAGVAAFPSPLPAVPALPLPPSLSGSTRGDAPPAPIVFNDSAAKGADPVLQSPVVYARDATSDTAEALGAPLRAAGDADRRIPEPVHRVGDRLQARLLTGIVVASGVPAVPVVAQDTADGSTWLGQASAQADGRVHISFQLAGTGGSEAAIVSGVALEPGPLSAGLPGRVTIRRRATAAAAIGAVMQAASDYAQALARAGQISVTDTAGSFTVAGAGPAWTYAAARLGDAVGTDTPGATVETVEIPAGTALVILVTETR
jgi:hypothetical protein